MHRGMQLNQKKQKLREKEACGHPHGVYVKSHVETTAVNSRYFYAWKPTLSQVNFYQSIQNSFFFYSLDTSSMIFVHVATRDRILRENYVLDRCI